jgi:hypothetical protein
LSALDLPLMRTTRETLTFEQPFSLAALDEVQRAGTYSVDVDEELIEGLSFLAYRRVSTTIYLPLVQGSAGSLQAVRVEPGELAAAKPSPSA